jgi:predicted ABC-type transport system involved in lysophospholipase L1 biosynthesis ATPase subunit
VDVLQGADLEIESGESIAVVGRSGAGKSTLLHILGALDRPDSGRVLLDGEDVYALSNKRRSRIRCERIGFVFQSYHLLPEMDVLENVMLPGMALGGLPRTTLREKASELLDMVGLADRCGHLPQELSGGEQQRVALARSLMNNPNMLMADEPTGNLDAATGSQVLDYVFGVISDRKHTLVMVTHDETIAQRCDRVYRLENGLVHGM